MEECVLSSIANSHSPTDKIGLVREAARRANWDALHGPRHSRPRKFNPSHPERSNDNEARRQDTGPLGDATDVGGV